MQAERVCLSLTSSYAAHWGAWEGLRELVQNWHDGALAAAGERDEVRFAKLGEYTYEARGSGGAALGSARYDGATQTLALTNVGAVDRTALLLGFSRKAARRDVVGCFGEGLKVGALALLRLGAELRLETGREMWRFALEPDEAFGGQEVLVVHITPHAAAATVAAAPPPAAPSATSTTLELVGIDEAAFALAARRLLWLEPARDAVATTSATLLLDAERAGELYVRGVWIQEDRARLAVGVDLADVLLDRDRASTLRPDAVAHHLSCAWLSALRGAAGAGEAGAALRARYLGLLERGETADVAHAAFYAEPDDALALARAFAEQQRRADGGGGSSSLLLPVSRDAPPSTLRRLREALDGVEGRVVLVSEPLAQLLANIPESAGLVGDARAALARVEAAAVAPDGAGGERGARPARRVAPAELAFEQRAALEHALQAAAGCLPGGVSPELGDVEIVDDPVDDDAVDAAARVALRSSQGDGGLVLRVPLRALALGDAAATDGGDDDGSSSSVVSRAAATVLRGILAQASPRDADAAIGRLLSAASAGSFPRCALCPGDGGIAPSASAELTRLAERERALEQRRDAERAAGEARARDDKAELARARDALRAAEADALRTEVKMMNAADGARREAEREAAPRLAAAEERTVEAERDAADARARLCAARTEVDRLREARARRVARLLDERPARGDVVGIVSDATALTACVVCLEAAPAVVLLPCKHLCLCAGCAPHLANCPVCRTPAASQMTVYA